MEARYAGTESPRLVEVADRQRSRLARRVALALATAALATLALAAPAAATTETFQFTGAAQTWIVPAGVTAASFDLYGAQGDGSDEPLAPGLGGRATAAIDITPGDSIQVNVGGQGVGATGGFNGGGDGAAGFSAGGGGGGSDIRIDGTALADRMLVAGGGGGTGGVACGVEGSAAGGGGGGESGLPGGDSGCMGVVAGGGGEQDATGGTATSPATPGDFGVGGDGAEGITGVVGGGGGGGWFGGGGGLDGGGGGGSGHGPAGTTFETGVRSGNGLVTVTYTVSPIESPPPPISGPPPPISGPPPPALPDNSFSFGKLKRNLNKGTAKLTVKVPGGGELELAKTKKVKADDESAAAAGNEKLLVKPRGKAKKKLNQTGKAKVTAKVTYTPTGGEPNTASKKAKLKLR